MILRKFKLNITLQLLFHADDVNVYGESLHILRTYHKENHRKPLRKLA